MHRYDNGRPFYPVNPSDFNFAFAYSDSYIIITTRIFNGLLHWNKLLKKSDSA